MKLLKFALDTAKSLGADYADIRVHHNLNEMIYLRNMSLKNTSQRDTYGYGIRIFLNGAWGFAHSNDLSEQSLIRTVKRAFTLAEQSGRIKYNGGLKLAPERSYVDIYNTPYEIDPFDVPLSDKVDLMMEVNKTMLGFKDIKQAMFMLGISKEEKLFASTLGTMLEINTMYIEPTFRATAVTPHDSQSRSYRNGGFAIGWEYMEERDWLEKAEKVAEEAIMKVKAETLKGEERRSLILDPMHLALTIHESVGHPTELDRVLGWEADFAGISFATPEKLGKYQYGSEVVNFVADNTLEKGLATAGYDDDGVPNQRWYIVKDGILQEYGSTRDTISQLGNGLSRGCNRATNYFDFPINRIPNLYLEPGQEELSPNDLIEDTEDGIYIEGQGSFSIDQHRVNFQFGGDMFWEIKDGKRVRPLKKIIYKSNNPEFWNSVDAICDRRFFGLFGVTNCGKGQPGQVGRMTHGAATTRFRNIRVGGSQ
ncbi:MAG: TldD/PmbA family protein [Candidatus Cloacimonadia bacterium]